MHAEPDNVSSPFNPTVVHIFRGERTVVTQANDDQMVIIDFDHHLRTPYPGWSLPSITCPHCKVEGSELEWNVATITDFSVDPDDYVTRIQDAADFDTGFTCAFCFHVSTSEELGLVPAGYIRINFEEAITRMKNNKQTFFRIQKDTRIYDTSHRFVHDKYTFQDVFHSDFFKLDSVE